MLFSGRTTTFDTLPSTQLARTGNPTSLGLTERVHVEACRTVALSDTLAPAAATSLSVGVAETAVIDGLRGFGEASITPGGERHPGEDGRRSE